MRGLDHIAQASKELRHEAADHELDVVDHRARISASKELRHEAADHGPLDALSPANLDQLQRSCGMKPQITTDKQRDSIRAHVLQRSCGMKPQIT
ncbi:hypothetical protein WQQ_15340 [Hydrocarboniphaga effusa AP103]|uniref:Uncharacterized protein n=1 Tax=Hydrocarboniphaga effusa AP103 TaxID=1172194 RepID=I7ZI18_9GAMM|nr:hypothetical protein WQQ_15340 [Hydrocarboniphaga effusa AP103]